MSCRRKKKFTSTVLGAFAGTVLFNAVFMFLSARQIAGVTNLPSWFESLSIYAFFFAIMWLSRGPVVEHR